MKVLYLTNDISVLGGVEKVILQKTTYFIDKFKYNITIISQSNKNSTIFFNIDKRINLINLDMNIEKNFFKRQFQRIKYFVYLKNFLKKNNYDIIISTGFILDPILFFFKKCIILKEFHISRNKNLEFNKKNIFKEKIEKEYLSRYDKIIILTNEDKKNWNLSNVEIIFNSLPFSTDTYPKYENKKIISVGRLNKQKGYDILIDIWNIVSKKYPDWILEIYGEGPEKEKLQDKINKLNLQKSFILKGATTNIQEKYLESSIYVMSSRYEGMPMVLLEAMSCGLPIVSFDCPCGPKDIIKDNEDGYLVKFGNIEKMAEKIEKLINDEEKRKIFGKRAKENIQRFSQDKIMQQWKELFENLVIEKNEK